MADPLLVLAAVLLGGIAVVSAALAYRGRLSFRIAARNIRRARGRTVLVVLGLLIGTAIISGSLVMGATIQTINVHYSYLTWGYTDEAVFGIAPGGGNLYFPQSIASQIVAGSAGEPTIAGVTPEIVDVVQVFDHTSGIPETNLHLVGPDPNYTAALGDFTTTGGAKLANPTGGAVFLDVLAATALNASPGDQLTLYGAATVPATVQAVVLDDLRGGVLTAGISGGTVFVNLATAQQVMNASGLVNVVAVTNAGSQVDGIGLTSTVSAHLNATLATIPGTARLSVHNLLQDSVSNAEAASSGTETIFLVFGLFSIVAGAMLIVGIFTMLAEERKGETGMLRAIGLQRRDVVLAYYFEGLIYAAGSALAGTFVGVATGYGLLSLYTVFVPNSGVSTATILGSFTYTQSDLLLSYLAGFLLTLATVAIASVRVSRLNIVRAVRDSPEPPPAMRTYTSLAYLGAAGLALGALLFAATVGGTGDVSYPSLGVSLMILGAGLVAARFVRNRIAFSAVGLGLLLWNGYAPLHWAVLGTAHSGGIFILFVEGISMVGGALLLIAFNATDLVRGIERLVAGRAGATPVTRVGFAYPSRRVARTSITLAIFALVLFTVVVLATYSATVTGNLNASVAGQTGGYSFFGATARPVADLPGTIAANASLGPMFAVVVPLVLGAASLSGSHVPGSSYTERLFAAPTNTTSGGSFYETSQFPFSSTYQGMSWGSVMSELATNRSVAVVDGNYGGGGFSATGSTAHPVLSPGDVVTVSNPATGEYRNLTVIALLEEQTLGGIWLNPAAAAALGYTAVNGYLITVAPGTTTTHAAQSIKRAFYQYGLVLLVFADVLATTTTLISGEIGLLEVFIALGLAVGIAALGILALRAISERRREIGMLRAIGLTKGMVLRAFLTEYTFVSLTGTAAGGLLGLLIIYNLVHSPGSSDAGMTTLYVPWLNLAVVLLATALLATLAVIGPSLRGARLPPAQAIREMG